MGSQPRQLSPFPDRVFPEEFFKTVLSKLFISFYKGKESVTPKSGLLLGGSCVAAIAAVGSIFELSSGEPELGGLVTGLILLISIPLTGYLFYAAVKDARANL